VLRDNRVETGRVVGVRNGNVMVAVTGGEKGWPLAVVSRVEMAEPAALTAARSALRAGDAARAIGGLRPIVEQFKGLPAAWAEEATGLLGEAYIAAADLPEAEATFSDFKRFYPGGRGAVRADLGMAMLDLSRNKPAAARKRLEPIVAGALKRGAVTAEDGATFGQAFLLLGRAQEAESRYPQALESYLLTVTVFHHDPAAAEEAQKRADDLRARQTVSVP